VQCLERTTVSSSVNRHSTFGVNTVRYSWNVTPGCGGLVYFVNGQEVGKSGSANISVPTSRYLSIRIRVGRFGTTFGDFGRQFVLAGRFVTYTPGLQPRVQSTSGAGSQFDATARRVTEAVKTKFMDDFVGKRLEIHEAPPGVDLTSLPPFDFLDPTAPTENPGDGNETNGDFRGYSAVDNGPTGFALAVESGIGTDVLAHELGHAVLEKASEAGERISTSGPRLVDELERARLAKRASGTNTVSCRDSYALSTKGEYFAEGTAAALGDELALCGVSHADELTRPFLTSHDRRLDCLVRVVYTLPPPSSTALSCSVVLSPGSATR
jgi:hypothetical protein